MPRRLASSAPAAYNVYTLLQPNGEPIRQTISSREFNQNVAKAKNMSDTAPVCITDRGEPAYVLMNYAAYRALNRHPQSNAERLGMSKEDLEFVGEVEFPRCIIADREELF